MPQDTDEALVLRYQRGDVAAFEALVDRHRAGVYRFLARFVRDRARAEDLTQECWMRFLGAAPRWEERARFRTWLYAVARNLAADEARRMTHRRHASLDDARGDRSFADLPAPGRSPEEAALDLLLQPALERAIAELPAEQREVFLLREYEGVGFAEIAEITGAPVPTVKSRMRYALEGLRRTLAAMGVTAGGEPALEGTAP
ncbi:RNA polymerase sigma factor [Anaeromyxobacter diazotrophicus]|uniref:RNA polymerase sigma factor n=1 Tax=Anaeromyxobacter diazotrophicus TaxID=2590199 RepID=A0A7I9VRC3_9BACT|nr:RNA polymerase sigma factor [Anaeromyxobacter diazotrophicus]GEJ58788.1 RNA polymerase sigma factor [Anaeromyxobacter diazotrophicus]